MVGQTLGHYRILGPLGKGGMGEVLLAEDTELGRKVALKVLPEAMALDPERLGRFRREAHILASLNHPNIVTVYSVETVDGWHFLTMELVEGPTLADYLPDQGVTLEEFFQIAVPLTDALGTAHAQGVIHRDLKPRNIMLTQSRVVKVLDFGLAKLVHEFGIHLSTEASTDTMTGSDRLVGTAPYMSPEQLQGRPLDHRSDIFSVGSIFHEILTGRRPFRGESGADLVSSILRDSPEPLVELRPELPNHLGRIVRRCLEKKPESRYQFTKDLKNDLLDLQRDVLSDRPPTSSATIPRGEKVIRARVFLLAGIAVAALLIALAMDVPSRWFRPATSEAVDPGTGLREPQTIAVLPFKPIGMSKDSVPADWPNLIPMLLASEIGDISGLALMDPLSSATLVERTGAVDDVDLHSTLERAGLSYVIRGTIRPTAGGVETTYSLVRVETGEVVLVERLLSENDEELSRQLRSITHSILDWFQRSTDSPIKARDIEPWLLRSSRNVEAVREFLHGTEYAYRFLPGGEPHFRRALELDPRFIAPRVWLVSALTIRGKWEEAERLVETLQALKSEASPFEQAMIGWAAAITRRDVEDTIRHLEVALGYSPGNNILLFNLGSKRAELGQFEDALMALSPAVETRWRFPPLYPLYAWVTIHAGEVDELREVLEYALGVEPADPYLPGVLEAVCLLEGDLEGAEEYGAAFRAEVSRTMEEPSFRELVPVYLELAKTARAKAELGKAKALLQRALDIDPENSLGTLQLALIEAEDGDRAMAERLYRSATQAAQPSAAEVYLLGELAQLLGQDEQARAHYARYLDLAPDGPEVVRARESLRVLEEGE